MSDEDKIQIAVLKERIDKWMDATIEYRKTLCDKISELKEGQIKMFQMLFDLPCKERRAWYSATNRQLLFMWGVITGIGGTIVAHILKKI